MLTAVFGKGRSQSIRVPRLEKDEVLGNFTGLVLLDGIIHTVFSRYTIKALDVAFRDFNVGYALILPDELLYRLLAMGLYFRFALLLSLTAGKIFAQRCFQLSAGQLYSGNN